MSAPDQPEAAKMPLEFIKGAETGKGVNGYVARKAIVVLNDGSTYLEKGSRLFPRPANNNSRIYVEYRNDGIHLLIPEGLYYKWDIVTDPPDISRYMPIAKIDQEQYWIRKGGNDQPWIHAMRGGEDWRNLNRKSNYSRDYGYEAAEIFSYTDDEGVLIEGKITYE